MDEFERRTRRAVRALWLAAGLIAVAAVLPVLLGGTSSRINAVAVPFFIAAIAIAATAKAHAQSRTVTSLLYFVGALATAYGLMSMLSVPVILAALGSCPTAPDACTSGLPRALTGGETDGIFSATIAGVAGLFVGFYGLFVLYRRTMPQPAMPPAHRASPPVKTPVAVGALVGSEPELPAPDELPELPAHESSTPTS